MNKRFCRTISVANLLVLLTIPWATQASMQEKQLLIRLKNGKTVAYSLDEIESIQFSAAAETVAAIGSATRDRDTLQAKDSSALRSAQDLLVAPVRLLAGSPSISGATGPAALFDGNSGTGWSSRPDARFPHEFLLELAQPAVIGTIEFDNATQEGLYPGASARDVTVFATNGGPSGPWINIASVSLARGVNRQRFTIAPVTAKWLRVAIRSNHGHPNYTQLMEVRFYQAGDGRRTP